MTSALAASWFSVQSDFCAQGRATSNSKEIINPVHLGSVHHRGTGMASGWTNMSGEYLRRVAALACGVCCLTLALPALSQEAGLRGAVTETGLLEASPLKRKVKKPKAKIDLPRPAYRPETPSNLPSEPDPLAQENGEEKPAVDPGADLVPLEEPKSEDDQVRPRDRDDAVLPSEVPVPDRTGMRAEDDDPEPVLRTERDNKREPAIDGRSRRREENPYAAPGISVGAFTVRPTLETGIRWTNNSDSSSTGKPAFLSETNLRLRAESDWSQHQLNLEATGSWLKSISGAETEEPRAGLAAELEIDLSKDSLITGGLGWNHSIEAASAPAAITGALSRATVDRLTASLAASHDLGIIGVRARINAERSSYGDVIDSTGAAVSQDDRNYTYAGLTLRASYEISPALSPFVEGEVGRRIYDNQTDSFGLERAATRLGVRTGVEANFSEKLRGDLAIGYLVENIDDPALEDISGLSLAGTMNWSPMRGTSFALTASTTVEGSSTAASAGSLLHGLNLAMTKRVRENLDLSANAGVRLRDYSGPNPNEVTFSAGAGFTYWFNRYVGWNSRVSHETVTSSDPTRESQTNSVFFGMTFRR
jgi:hypothetical protein